MAKRSLEGSPRLAIAREGTFYSEDDITEIIEAVGKKFPAKHRKELADRLERAADKLAMNRALQRAPTNKMNRTRFEAIDNAARKLLDALGVGPAGGIRAMPSPILDGLMKAAISAAEAAERVGAKSDSVLAELIVAARPKASRLGKSNSALIRDALTSVVLLQRLSRHRVAAASEAQERSDNVNWRHVGDQARKQWIVDLADIYCDMWKRKPTVSRDAAADRYIGPFFRFVEASGRAVGVDKSNPALGKIILRATSNTDKST